MLGFDAAFFLCWRIGACGLAGLCFFLAAGVGIGRCAEQTQGDAGAQQRAEQWTACGGVEGFGAGEGVGHGRCGGCVVGREECGFLLHRPMRAAIAVYAHTL